MQSVQKLGINQLSGIFWNNRELHKQSMLMDIIVIVKTLGRIAKIHPSDESVDFGSVGFGEDLSVDGKEDKVVPSEHCCSAVACFHKWS